MTGGPSTQSTGGRARKKLPAALPAQISRALTAASASKRAKDLNGGTEAAMTQLKRIQHPVRFVFPAI